MLVPIHRGIKQTDPITQWLCPHVALEKMSERDWLCPIHFKPVPCIYTDLMMGELCSIKGVLRVLFIAWKN